MSCNTGFLLYSRYKYEGHPIMYLRLINVSRHWNTSWQVCMQIYNHVCKYLFHNWNLHIGYIPRSVIFHGKGSAWVKPKKYWESSSNVSQKHCPFLRNRKGLVRGILTYSCPSDHKLWLSKLGSCFLSIERYLLFIYFMINEDLTFILYHYQ